LGHNIGPEGLIRFARYDIIVCPAALLYSMPSLFNDLLSGWLPGWPQQPSDSMDTEKTYRPHDAHDVYHMAFLLNQVLIPDLIPTILELAEYWTKTTYERQDPKSYYQETAGRPYLSAAAHALEPRMVRKLEFTITSHDQGWSSYSEWHGTYDGSWTWFEAEIRQADGEAGTNTRRICTNVHADRNDKTHVVTWRSDAEDEEESDFLRALGPRSVVLVVPWARYPGWQNFVSSAKVDIYAACVRRL
jgi:hypothetical protein